MTLVFETHATTIDNETGHATGWLPGQLSAIGRAQARELGLRRRDEAIDVIVASDLRRAVETVEVAFSGLDVPVSFDSRLRECNYGRLNGAPVTELRRPDHLDTPYPDGGSWWQAVDRVVRWLAEARVAYEGRRVLVIGHTATRWALDEAVNGVPLAHSLVAPFDWQPGWEYRFD
jgi:2,3-bisphosphoglycerate-dependent phosphoglycerate mutase